MRIVNFGSLNIDRVFRVDGIVRPGETVASSRQEIHAGGKGLNQSVALARAGADVSHAGLIGADGDLLRETLRAAGVRLDYLTVGDGASGQAFIQVSAAGENAIVLAPGANHAIARESIQSTLDAFDPGDILLVQNETNGIPFMMERAKARGLRVCINVAPLTPEALAYPLALADWIIVNRIEAAGICGLSPEEVPERLLETLRQRYPDAAVLVTLGADGACHADGQGTLRLPACTVDTVVDTTAAGDTFVGYFLAGMARGDCTERAMRRAMRASAIAVTRRGASSSIPHASEVPAD